MIELLLSLFLLISITAIKRKGISVQFFENYHKQLHIVMKCFLAVREHYYENEMRKIN